MNLDSHIAMTLASSLNLIGVFGLVAILW